MSGFFWNVRGLNRSKKHSIIKKWVEENKLKFGCLIETRVRDRKVPLVASKVFNEWSVLTNYEYNRRGRIWLVWGPDVLLTLFYKSAQMITCSIKLPDQDEAFFCSFIYGYNTATERKELWLEIRDHANSPLIGNKPWMIMGDFNETLDLSEHSHLESQSVVTAGMRDFQSIMNYCSFSDLAAHGPLFTWSNKREADLIAKKLDRVMVNACWLHSFPTSYSVFEAGGCSDHMRCRIELQASGGNTHLRRNPFKFINAVTSLSEFKLFVRDAWQTTEPLYMSTSTLYRFSKKLKELKPGLRQLAKNRLEDLIKKSKEAYEDLCKKQEQTLLCPSAHAMDEENKAYERWERVASLEEKYLKQRSKLHWLQVGDKNNKTFHRAVLKRAAKNSIREVHRPDGSVYKDLDGIKFEAERFFREFLQLVPDDYEEVSVDILQGLMLYRCSEHDKTLLTRPVSAEEIQKVLFAMPNDKLPGPDGFTSEFYKAAWDSVGHEFVLAVLSSFVKGFLPKGVNSTILALIPKKSKAREMKDYRLISCCNVLYKVISKILANRLKSVLPKFIVGNQSAFVKNKLLIENVLLATELVKDYHKDAISNRCAIKIDISKAFDSV